jgi:hypothetical protein
VIYSIDTRSQKTEGLGGPGVEHGRIVYNELECCQINARFRHELFVSDFPLITREFDPGKRVEQNQFGLRKFYHEICFSMMRSGV